jgi:CDP-diacylglycerol---glycerol-3-phosphate 3-phosphatidyltransferase
METATKITFSRMICAPVFFILYFFPVWLRQFPIILPISVFVMLPLLAFGYLTDYLDGKYARKHNQVSDFGKVFDPFADVCLNITVFLCLLLSGYMPGVIFLCIIYREISMTFVRVVAMQKGVTIAARKGGKIKTVIYIISCLFALLIESSLRLGLFSAGDFPIPASKLVSLALFILCLVLSYISFADYLICFRKVLIKEK